MAKTNVEALRTPTDLSNQPVNKVAEALNGILADTFSLYVKTRNFHWHMSGPHFRDYHLLLDEQADQIYATIDPIAERIRKLGERTLTSIGDIARRTSIQDNDKPFVEAQAMLVELMNDNKACVEKMREAHEICDDAKDVASASLLENFIDDTERRVWFLFETTRRQD